MSAVDRPSPRTAEEPMAFTTDELLRGGLSAWVCFLIMLVAGIGVLCGIMAFDHPSDPVAVIAMFLGFSLLTLLVGAPISLILLPFGVLLAKPLGYLLRRTSRLSVHVVVYAALGVALGVGYVALLRGGNLWAPLVLWDGLILVPAFAVAVAVPLGWWRTARRVLDEDAGLRPRKERHRRIDTDALAEDAATGESN